MKTRVLIAILMILPAFYLQAQTFFNLNTANPRVPDVVFHNPAAATLFVGPSAFIGLQLPVTRFSSDDLRNNFLSYVQPIGQQTAIGLRAQYFTSNVFQNGDFALLLSQKIYGDILAVGVNFGLVTYGYNSDEFHLFDFNDPLLESGTNRQVVTFGLGATLQPRPNLLIGASINHLNKPNISLNGDGVGKDRVINLGVAMMNMPAVPQLDFRLEGDELFTQAGVSGNLLNERLNVFAGYGKYSTEGSSFFVQSQIRFDDLGLLYSFQNPLTQDFSYLSRGTHQIGLFYSKARKSSVPTIELGDVKTARTNNVLVINAIVQNKDGLDGIEIINNNAIKYKLQCEKGTKRQDLQQTIQLDEGDNHIEIKALTKKATATRDIFSRFEPLPPQLHITSLRNKQVNEQQHQLQFFASDNIALQRIEILHNGRLLKVLGAFDKPDSIRVPIDVTLNTGRNDFKIVAYNKWRVSADSTWIVYREGEPVPILTIDSPQRPVSGSSSITLNLEMTNYQRINYVVIKLNGIIVDSIQVPPKERGLGGVRPGGGETFVATKVVPIKDAANMIDATAFSRDGQPRTSHNMRIFYNRYKDHMKYDKKWGIVVGIDNYQEGQIWDLDYAVKDAHAVGQLLKNDLGFDKIISLFNKQATAENLRAVLSDSLMKLGKNDLVVFYFAGHGFQVENIEHQYEGYLLPQDGASASPSKNVSMEFLRRNSLLSPAKSIVYFIDACYSGLGKISSPVFSDENKISYEDLKRSFDKQSRIIIAAGEKDQAAVDGLFARVLRDAFIYENPDVQDLRKADLNGDGYITTTELGRYLQDNVMSVAVRELGPDRAQKPQIGWWTADRGEVVLK